MPRSYRERLPRDTVRDLLAIARALYRAERDAGASAERLAKLAEIGKWYREALDLSGRTEHDTMGHRAAWIWAERATQALGELIAEDVRLAPAFDATARVLR
jgi:hypothetical protein